MLKDDYKDNSDSKRNIGEKSLAPGGSWWNARAKNNEELRTENKRKMIKCIRNHSLRCKGTGEVEHDMEGCKKLTSTIMSTPHESRSCWTICLFS
jgi:hypothetical protein